MRNYGVTVDVAHYVSAPMKGKKMTGKIEQAKGHAKQALGELTGSKKLTAEGKIDVATGKAKEIVQTASKAVGGTSKKIKKIQK